MRTDAINRFASSELCRSLQDLGKDTAYGVGLLSWRLSITMEAAFCVEPLEDALACHGKPEIFNTDQGSQAASSPARYFPLAC